MAVYSRNQTISQTQSQPTLDSKSISSVIVQSFDNIKDTIEDNLNDDKKINSENIAENITEGIDNSKLVTEKSKESSLRNKESNLGELLKSTAKSNADELKKLIEPKKSSNSEKLGELLNTTSKQDDKESLINKKSSNSEKLGELLNTTSKQDEDNNKQEDRKHKSNTLAMLGQIVKSNNPLKIISGLIVKQVAKWGLILALGSQLIVLLKAGWHELILNVPIWFDKLKAGLVAEIVTIPDKFMLTLRQALQGTTLGSMMGFGGLTKEEKTERDNIGKEKLENGQKVKDLVLKSQQGIGEFQNLAEGLGLNPDDYNMNDKVSRGKLIGDIKRELVRRKNEGTLHDDPRLNEIFGIPGTFEGENGDENAYIAFTNKLNNQTSRWGEAIDAANNLDAFSEEDREKILRYTELTERMAPKKLTDEEKQAKNAEIKAKKEEAYSQSLTESYTKRLNAGEAGTEYQQQEYAAAGANVRQAQAAWSEAHGGREFNRMETTTKGERVAEHYLTHEFMEWKQAWADLGKHLSQNIGVSVVQKVERDNVLNCNGRR